MLGTLFVCLHLSTIFSCRFSSSLVVIIGGTGESCGRFVQERGGSAGKISSDNHCNKKKGRSAKYLI